MQAIEHGWKPTHGGPGPSPEVAKEILHGKKKKKKHNPYQGWLMALDIGPFKRKKKVDDDPKESKRRRKRAREQAVKGYKRKGGL